MKHAGLRQRLARSHATRFGLLLLILVVACALSASFWFSSDPRNMVGPPTLWPVSYTHLTLPTKA
mgnify:CR=1 FL=1